jgi:flagellar motor switch/type III secretory pathway protein FliN
VNAADLVNRFQDLQFPLEVEFGSLEISVREMLELKAGSVLRTSHPARAPLTLRAGNAPIAAVETVVNEGTLSVRVQKILENIPEGTAPRTRTVQS